MEQSRRKSIALGLILVLFGAAFLVVQLIPGLQEWLVLRSAWPLLIVGLGVAFLIFGIVIGVPAMAVPASILGGIGLLLYWQNATGNWQSWAYAWTLIPGFVGIGIILAGLLGQDTRSSIAGGAWLVVISLALYAVFASFLGGGGFLGPYWPVLLIALGALLLVRSLVQWR